MSATKSKEEVYALPSVRCSPPEIVTKQDVVHPRVILICLAVRYQLSEPWRAIMHTLVLNLAVLDAVARSGSTQMGYIWLNRAQPCASRTRMALGVVASCSWLQPR